jgi:hypothetical protein
LALLQNLKKKKNFPICLIKIKQSIRESHQELQIQRRVITAKYFLRKYQPVDHQKPLTKDGIMKHLERFKDFL